MHIIFPLSLLAVVISITNATCTKPDENKAKVWKAQAKHVKSVIENLEKAETNKDVFTGFGEVLKKLTKDGAQCTQATKDAFRTLTDCPTTAKASCEKTGLDLAAIKAKATSVGAFDIIDKTKVFKNLNDLLSQNFKKFEYLILRQPEPNYNKEICLLFPDIRTKTFYFS